MLKHALIACATLAVCLPAAAQEPTNAPSATMPAPGLLTIRPMLRYDRLGNDPTGADRDVDRVREMLHAAYGLKPGLVAFGEFTLAQRSVDSPGPADGSDAGVADSILGLRYRFFRHDSGPLDTLRFAVQGAVRVPTGTDEFSSDSFNPSIGVTMTMIRGRHGVNASAKYELTTGSTPLRLDPGDALADHVQLTAAYLYRLAPASYADSSHSAWYTQIELLGHAETNGDADLEVAPGILYEARRWAVEASVILPVADDLERRPRRELGLVLGVRLLF